MRRLLVLVAVLVAGLPAAGATAAPPSLTVPSAAATAPAAAASPGPPTTVLAPPAPPDSPAAAVRGPGAVAPVAGAVRRAFAQPDGPYGRGHRGVDLGVRPSEPVRAALPGTVRFAGLVAGEAWITVTHDGGLETTYGGVAATVERGQRVQLGQPLGRMRTGRRHLDWGARVRGGYIDPLGLLAGWRVRLVPHSAGR